MAPVNTEHRQPTDPEIGVPTVRVVPGAKPNCQATSLSPFFWKRIPIGIRFQKNGESEVAWQFGFAPGTTRTVGTPISGSVGCRCSVFTGAIYRCAGSSRFGLGDQSQGQPTGVAGGSTEDPA